MKRQVYHKKGKEIDRFLLQHVTSISNQAFDNRMKKYQTKVRTKDSTEGIFIIDETVHIASGKDWYIIYSCPNEREIFIVELARIEPNKGEGTQQLREIVAILRELVETDKIITTDLKEDTSYPLFLISKKRGIIQQVGNDEMYYWEYPFIPKTVVSERKQEELYKKLVKKRKPSKQIRMHLVSFAKDK